MSQAVPEARPGVQMRLQQLVALTMVLALLWVATRLVPAAGGGISSVAAIGFLLLAGTLASELLEPLKVPHLTAYILAGVIAGPYVLQLFDHKTVEEVSRTNSLAAAHASQFVAADAGYHRALLLGGILMAAAAVIAFRIGNTKRAAPVVMVSTESRAEPADQGPGDETSPSTAASVS